MAPTHKKSGNDPDNKKGRRILRWFGFRSKMIRKDSLKVDEKAVPKWGENAFKVVQISDDEVHHHAMPLAKLLLIDADKSLEKREGIEKLMKKFNKVSKENCAAKSESQPPLHESCKLDSQKSWRKRQRKKRGSSRRKLEGDAIAAMTILMVILVIMLLCGRLCAIICASICFYCLPRFTKTTDYNNKNKNNDQEHARLEFDSEAYKRKVVLEGILARSNKMEVGIS